MLEIAFTLRHTPWTKVIKTSMDQGH